MLKYVLVVLFLGLLGGGVAAEPRISDHCYIEPKDGMKEIYQEILGFPIDRKFLHRIHQENLMGAVFNADGPLYTVTFMRREDANTAVMTWMRPEGLVAYVDTGIDGEIDVVFHQKRNGQEREMREGDVAFKDWFTAWIHGCHTLEQAVRYGVWEWVRLEERL